MHTFTVSLLGTSFAIDLDPSTVPDAVIVQLQELWGDAVVDATPADRVYVALGAAVVPDGYDYFARADGPQALAVRLSDVLVSTAMSRLIPPEASMVEGTKVSTMGVYACAVAHEEDDAASGVVLLGAASSLGGGHRTAVMTALGCRFRHLSDAAVAIDAAQGTVLGAPKPLSRFDTELLSSRREVPLVAAGLRPLAAPAALRAFVFLERHDGADEASWEALAIPHATARLAPAVPVLPALANPMQDLAGLVAQARVAVVVRYRDESELPGVLEDVLATDVDHRGAMVIPIDPTADETGAPEPGMVRRVPVRDGVSDGTDMAVYRLDRTPVAIGGIAPHVWDLTRSWIGVTDLTDQLVARLGAPDGADAQGLVERAIDDLVSQKVLAHLG